jgi:hypothetical protein
MEENTPSAGGGQQRWRSRAKVGGLLAAGALAGVVLAGAIPAVAGSISGSTTDSSPTSEPTPGTGGSTDTPGTQENREDCPPGGRGGPRPDRNGATPDEPAPEQTPASGDAAFGGIRT